MSLSSPQCHRQLWKNVQDDTPSVPNSRKTRRSWACCPKNERYMSLGPHRNPNEGCKLLSLEVCSRKPTNNPMCVS